MSDKKPKTRKIDIDLFLQYADQAEVAKEFDRSGFLETVAILAQDGMSTVLNSDNIPYPMSELPPIVYIHTQDTHLTPREYTLMNETLSFYDVKYYETDNNDRFIFGVGYLKGVEFHKIWDKKDG